MDARVLVIGYGSPIRGDDAIGPLAADRLAREALAPGVEVIARHILTAELVPEIAARDRVIFLDAAANGQPGEVRCRRLQPDTSTVSTMAHFLDPRELLGWCEALFGRVPETFLITACGGSFDYSSYSLSETGERALLSMLELTRTLLDVAGPAASGAEPRLCWANAEAST